MKYVKILGVLAVASAAMMAFTGSASADYVTTTTGEPPGTPNIHAVNENGHIFLENAWATVPCASTISGTPTSHGLGANVSGPIGVLIFTGCTNSWHVTTIKAGTLTVEATGGHNGTLFSNGARVEMTRFGINCVYETSSAHIGTVTGGNPATMHIDGFLLLDEDVSSGFCDLGAAWFADYVTTSALYVVNS